MTVACRCLSRTRHSLTGLREDAGGGFPANKTGALGSKYRAIHCYKNVRVGGRSDNARKVEVNC